MEGRQIVSGGPLSRGCFRCTRFGSVCCVFPRCDGRIRHYLPTRTDSQTATKEELQETSLRSTTNPKNTPAKQHQQKPTNTTHNRHSVALQTRTRVLRSPNIVELYLSPPESVVVLSVHRKNRVQALARPQPTFPMMTRGPGAPLTRPPPPPPHCITSLFTVLNITDKTVISSPHHRHRP